MMYIYSKGNKHEISKMPTAHIHNAQMKIEKAVKQAKKLTERVWLGDWGLSTDDLKTLIKASEAVMKALSEELERRPEPLRQNYVEKPVVEKVQLMGHDKPVWAVLHPMNNAILGKFTYEREAKLFAEKLKKLIGHLVKNRLLVGSSSLQGYSYWQ